MNFDSSYEDFEDIYNELKDKKIRELSKKDIGKYLLLAEELDWLDDNVGDDKLFYKFDKVLLERLSFKFEDSIFRLINEEFLYDNDLHKEPELESNNDFEEGELEL